MAMEISSSYKNYESAYLKKAPIEPDMAKEVLQEQRTDDKNRDMPIAGDEYISSEKAGNKPSGLYHMGQDADGNPKVIYDDPKKEEKKQIEQQIRAAVGNAEKVDALKKKLAQIEGELSQKDNDTYRRQNAAVS